LGTAKVRARVAQLVAEGAEQAGVDVARVDSRDWHASLSATSVSDTVTLTPSDQLDADTASAIGEVVETKEGIPVKMHDKMAASTGLELPLTTTAPLDPDACRRYFGNRKVTVNRPPQPLAAASGLVA
jgi:hypothetical protein